MFQLISKMFRSEPQISTEEVVRRKEAANAAWDAAEKKRSEQERWQSFLLKKDLKHWMIEQINARQKVGQYEYALSDQVESGAKLLTYCFAGKRFWWRVSNDDDIGFSVKGQRNKVLKTGIDFTDLDHVDRVMPNSFWADDEMPELPRGFTKDQFWVRHTIKN